MRHLQSRVREHLMLSAGATGPAFVWPDDADVKPAWLVFAVAASVCLIRVTSGSLRWLFMLCSSLCMRAEWKAAAAACAWVQKTDYCCHTGNFSVFMCSHCVSDPPSLCEQHSRKVSHLRLRIDMISARSEKPLQTAARAHN